MNFPFFPGTNLNDVNLDWIIARVKALSTGIIAPYINKSNNHWMEYDTSAEQFVDSGVSAAGEGVGPQGEPGKSPVIGSNGNWYTWDVATQAYVDTQVPAKGEDGASAYDEAMQGGYSGTETQFMNDLADVSEKLPVSAACYTIIGKQSANAIPIGSYVYLQHSAITGLSDGLYRASVAIAAQTDVTASELNTVETNGFNDLAARKIEMAVILGPIQPGESATTPPLTPNAVYFFGTTGATANKMGLFIVLSRTNGTVVVTDIKTSEAISVVGNNNHTVTVSNLSSSGILSAEYFRYF